MKSMMKIIEAKLPKTLKKFIKENIVSKGIQDTLARTTAHPLNNFLSLPQVSDKRLCQIIKDKFGIKCKHSMKIHELFRGIRMQLTTLVEGRHNHHQFNEIIL